MSASAHLICAADGNLLGSIWYRHATPGLNVSVKTATRLTTSWLYSGTFAGNNSWVRGVCVHLCLRAQTPAGALEIALYNITAGQNVATVTHDVAAIPVYTDNFIAFLFSGQVQLVSGNNYRLQIRTTASDQCSVIGSSYDLNMILISTNLVAPEGDCAFYIIPAVAANGTWTDYSVVANTNTTTVRKGLHIGGACRLDFPTNQNSWLRLAGDIHLGDRAVLAVGTAANPIPAQYTAVLEQQLTTDGEYSITLRGQSQFHLAGASLFPHTWCLLAQDAAAEQDTIVVDRQTGWRPGDEIALSGTGVEMDEMEQFTIDAISGTTITLDGELAYDHTGTYPTQGEVINLTRNVILRTTSSDACGRIVMDRRATVALRWARVENFGYSGYRCGWLLVQERISYVSYELLDGSVYLGYCSFVNCSGLVLDDYHSSIRSLTMEYCVGVEINYSYSGSVGFWWMDPAPKIKIYILYNCFILASGSNYGWIGLGFSDELSLIGNRVSNSYDTCIYLLYDAEGLDASKFRIYGNCCHTSYVTALYCGLINYYMQIGDLEQEPNIFYYCGLSDDDPFYSTVIVEDYPLQMKIYNTMVLGSGTYYEEEDEAVIAGIYFYYGCSNLDMRNCVFASLPLKPSAAAIYFSYGYTVGLFNNVIRDCSFGYIGNMFYPLIRGAIAVEGTYAGNVETDITCINCAINAPSPVVFWYSSKPLPPRCIRFINCSGISM